MEIKIECRKINYITDFNKFSNFILEIQKLKNSNLTMHMDEKQRCMSVKYIKYIFKALT